MSLPVTWTGTRVTLNLPLVSGDRIMGYPDSRIEVELGDGTFVRISGETDVLFPELSQKKTLLKLHEGDLILRVNDAGPVQVDLDQASVKIRKQGLYRIQVDPDGSIRLVVHKGRAEVSSRHGKERVETGQQLLLDARRIGIQALVRDLDDFELWSGRRDAVMVSSRSAGYLGGVHFPGVESLDQHGYWAHAGTFGHVWVPDASAGWAPFRFGRWRYLSTGLTWMSHEPWGWLPYHYGRWIYYQPMGRWAWVPGGFNRYRAAAVDFFWGSGYLGWAPRGYYGRGIGGGSPTTVVQNNTLHNWNPRDRSNGLTVVNRNDLGRQPTTTRGLAADAIVGGLRQGLPRELRRSRVWNRNSALSRMGSRASRLASRSTANPREGIAQGGARRPTVSRSDTEGRGRIQSRRDTLGRSSAGIDRSRTRSQQSFRSDSRTRSFSRTSPGSRGSFNTRSNRNASRPSVWSSRRSGARYFSVFFESVGPVLFATHFPNTVDDLPAGSHLSLSGSIGQPFAQPTGTVSTQAIRLFRRRLPLPDHLPQSKLIRGSHETRSDARRQQIRKKRATLVVARFRFGTGTTTKTVGGRRQSGAVPAATGDTSETPRRGAG